MIRINNVHGLCTVHDTDMIQLLKNVNTHNSPTYALGLSAQSSRFSEGRVREMHAAAH